VTIYYKDTPTIELSSDIKGRIYAAELVLKALGIPYKIVKKTSQNDWKDKNNENEKNLFKIS